MFVQRFACAAIALVFASTAVPALARGLEFEDLRQAVTVATPQISPNGASVVYVRSRIDWKNDRRDSELVLVDIVSGTSRVLTHDRLGVHAPQWSPDGSAIAYLASPDAKSAPQIYVLPLNGGDSQKITSPERGVQTFTWRPDSRAIAYTSQDDPPKKDGAAKFLDAVTITDNDYLTREAPLPVHLWSVDRDGAHATRLTSGTWSVASDPQWSHDGTKIYYQRSPDAIFAHFVSQTTYVHDIAAKSDTALGYGIDSSPQISLDGNALAIALPRHGSIYLQQDLSVRSLADGHELFNSRSIDRNVHGITWMPGGSVLIDVTDGVRALAWLVPPQGAARKLDTGDVDIAAPTASHNGALAFVGQRPDDYGEVYYLAPGASAPKKLSDDNAWIRGFDVAKSEPFNWPTDFGTQAVGVLTYPIGYTAGKKYPLVLDIHGGPISTSTWDLAGVEAPMDQVLAKRGYFVFRPNYRGSDNQGDAFLQAIIGDVTSGPGRDNLAAVDALKKTGMIDDTRIFVSGWSGGGLQTSWLIGHASFWRAAVTGAGVDDWYQQAVLSDINENFVQVLFGGATPYDKAGRAAYIAESPITYVDKMKTPTLILTDSRDQRVPIPQSFVLYHALKERGVPVQLTEFPRAGHFPTDPVGIEQALRSWADWFDRWEK